MRRLYLRVLSAAMLAFLVGATLLGLTLLRVRDADRQVVAQSLHGGMVAAEQTLSDRGATPQVLAELRRQFRLDLQLRPPSELPAQAQRELAPGETTYFMSADGGFAAIPHRQQVLVLGPIPDFQLPPAWELLLTLLLVSLVFAGVLALGLLPTWRRLGELESGALALASGRFDTRVQESGELYQLGHTLNHLAGGIESHRRAQAELLHAVSHELRTPLARLAFALEALPVEEGDLGPAEREIHHLDALVGELLTWSRAGEDTLSPTPLALPQDLPDQTLSLSGPPVRLLVDHRLFLRCLDNLVRNARLHGAEPIRVHWTRDGQRLTLCVDDAGAGIPEHDRQRALQPFAQLGAGPGHGLGLAIADRSCARHGGTLRLETSPLGGLRARTDWPVHVDTERDTGTNDSGD
ncbi:MAG: ATP-binding protein [Myxococcota bacterium]|nr:ATP-binding protein [Myxococcota bacterium]